MSPKITSAQLGAEIVRQASLYQNLLETRPNTEWDNPATPEPERALSNQLKAVMGEAGWEAPWAYCAAFAEGMVILACRRLGFEEVKISRIRKLMTPHVMTTARNLAKAGLLDDLPSPGSVWLARHRETDKGHAGIVVTRTDPYAMRTIEGNTVGSFKDSASDRQGDGIFLRHRARLANGDLNTQGFFNPDKMLLVLA